jgi:hypothetical protein
VADSTNPRYHDFKVIIGKYEQVDSVVDTLWQTSIMGDFYFNRPVPIAISVKPNPQPEPFKLIFLDDTHASLDGITQRTNYTIFDALGKTILQKSADPNEPIDLSMLAHGFYILRIEGSVNQSFKIVR